MLTTSTPGSSEPTSAPPPKRFYLGDDEGPARQRKEQLVAFWTRTKNEGWSDENVAIARAIAKGVAVKLTQGGSDEEHARKERRMAAKVPSSVDIEATAQVADFHSASMAIMERKMAELEARLREVAGTGAVEGLTVTVPDAIDAYHKYRRETEIDPDTSKPRDAIVSEGHTLAVCKRVGPTCQLSALSFSEIHRWCKAVAARPVSLKTGRPIKRMTVRNCLKAIRQFIRWAGRNYGWKRPDDWMEATTVMVRRTAAERHEAVANVSRHYTVDELATLWRYALPSERMLILMGLNFGFVYSEHHSVTASMLDAEEMAAIRGKTETIGRWQIWPETRELAKTEFDRIPSKRQDVANRWNRLLDRITKDIPAFRKLSYKWLRKTGSSFIRQVGDGELTSLYLSHGETASTDDDLLELYAGAKWDDLNKALAAFRDLLGPMFSAQTTDARTYLPISKIDRIRQLWTEGAKPADIMKETGTSHATIYRYRPALRPEPQPA